MAGAPTCVVTVSQLLSHSAATVVDTVTGGAGWRADWRWGGAEQDTLNGHRICDECKGGGDGAESHDRKIKQIGSDRKTRHARLRKKGEAKYAELLQQLASAGT